MLDPYFSTDLAPIHVPVPFYSLFSIWPSVFSFNFIPQQKCKFHKFKVNY